MIVAFDVDGTLIDDNDGWRTGAIDLATGFVHIGAILWVWSFGGHEYADTWRMRLHRDHGVITARALDKYDWINDQHMNRGEGFPEIDLHVDDTWSPRQISGIITPYPHGLTRFVPKGRHLDMPMDPDLRAHATRPR